MFKRLSHLGSGAATTCQKLLAGFWTSKLQTHKPGMSSLNAGALNMSPDPLDDVGQRTYTGCIGTQTKHVGT